MSVVVPQREGGRPASSSPKANHPRILRAAQTLMEQRICRPVLLGKKREILDLAREAHLLAIPDLEIIDPLQSEKFAGYARRFYELRQRAGVSWAGALYRMRQRNTFGAMMLRDKVVDGLVTGMTRTYPEAIRPSLEIIRTQEGRRASGTYIVAFKDSLKLFADCTVNADPNRRRAGGHRHLHGRARARLRAHAAHRHALVFELRHRPPGSPLKVRQAVDLVRKRRPDLEVEGEMQVDPAVVRSVREAEFPFSKLTGNANVLVFPDLNSGNIGYKLLWRLGGAEVIGPVLMGMAAPVNVLQQGASVQDMVNLAAMTAVRAQGELAY